MTPERIVERWGRLATILVTAALLAWTAIGLVSIGGALHDAFHIH